jgi:hypothetical protein
VDRQGGAACFRAPAVVRQVPKRGDILARKSADVGEAERVPRMGRHSRGRVRREAAAGAWVLGDT